jgi:hypothetical protein
MWPTGRKYWFSVFHPNGYKTRDNGQDFRDDAEAGDVFELTTKKSNGGNPNLLLARKISAGASKQVPLCRLLGSNLEPVKITR